MYRSGCVGSARSMQTQAPPAAALYRTHDSDELYVSTSCYLSTRYTLCMYYTFIICLDMYEVERAQVFNVHSSLLIHSII